jgi:hypothetical protein
MKSILSKTAAEATGTAALVAGLIASTKGRGSVVDSATAGRVIAMEGLSDSSSSTLDDALTNFRSLIAASNKSGTKYTVAQEDAAVVAAVYGSAAAGYARRAPLNTEALRSAAAASLSGPVHIVPATDSAERVAMEAFDEKANANAMVFSAAYNVQSAKQNEFAEAFYPTVTIGPDQVGFNVNVRLIQAYSEVTRSASGALNNFNRKNIIRAIIDASILAVDQTKLIPVYRSTGGNDSSANFVAAIATTTLTVDGAPLPTRPLAIGKKFSILGISQTDAALAAGQQDQTDAVDSSVRLGAIYLKVSGLDAQNSNAAVTEYYKVDTSNMPTSDFNAAVQGNTRLLTLRFQTKAIKLTKDTKTTAAGTSVLLDALSTGSVRLGVTLTGEITQDLGDTIVQTTPVTIEAVNDVNGVALDTGSGAGATAAGVLSDVTVVGYDLIAYRTNSNRRNRGKLIDVQHVNFLYTVPLLPPITALRPVSGQDGEDGNTLSMLVTATRIQTSNAAVTALLATKATLEAHSLNADAENVANQPALFGAASLLINPAYLTDTVDCATDLDSLTTTARTEDLQILLINKIRDMSARLFVASGYGPALEAMYEGTPPKVTIIIGCDPILHRYLTLNGDTRLTGDQFDYKIVPSYDQRMVNQIVFSFGLESSFNSGVVNPLHFGNMGWKPELTLMLPMVRNGNQVMELTVQPSYRHVTNLPIMGTLTVTNVDTVIGGKVAIQNHPV